MRDQVTVKIENTYADGHESSHDVVVDAPTGTDDESIGLWWEEEVLPHTGDGHGAKHPKLGFHYQATITESEDAAFLGLTEEWDG